MILVNVTLLFQTINFFIAFVVIKYLLVKPTIFFIQAEDNLQELLVATIFKYQTQMAHKEKELVDRWRIIQSYFFKHSQDLIKEPILTGKIPSLTLPIIDQKTIEEETQRLSKALAKKVDHVW